MDHLRAITSGSVLTLVKHTEHAQAVETKVGVIRTKEIKVLNKLLIFLFCKINFINHKDNC